MHSWTVCSTQVDSYVQSTRSFGFVICTWTCLYCTPGKPRHPDVTLMYGYKLHMDPVSRISLTHRHVHPSVERNLNSDLSVSHDCATLSTVAIVHHSLTGSPTNSKVALLPAWHGSIDPIQCGTRGGSHCQGLGGCQAAMTCSQTPRPRG